MILFRTKLKRFNQFAGLESTPPEMRFVSWVLEISKNSICLVERVTKLNTENKEYEFDARYYGLYYNPNGSRWGRDHFYYDGPHDSFNLGSFQYCWSGDWCTKCMPG